MTEEETQDVWEQSKKFLRCKEKNKQRPLSLLEKLRWVTLGFHYNCNSKSKLIAVCSEKCLTWSNSSSLLAVLCVVHTQEIIHTAF
jgi:hypothetical protein